MARANLTYVKNKLGEGFAKKKFGQNFLIDDNVVDKIARIACDPELSTIEIGPGLGALSEHLLEYSKDVTAYEIDRDMYNILQDEFKDEDRFRVILGDFLDADLSVYENQRLNVASNLPYYVTTPILFKLFNSKIDFNKITVMVQKEVCERFVAKVNTEDYNSLSIIVQYLFEVKMEMSVKKTCFYPSPKVDSAIVSFTPKRKRDFEYEKGLCEFLDKCFTKRRKTLNNNLKDFLSTDEILNLYNKCGLKDNVRAQELELNDFIGMYEVLRCD